MAAKKMRRRPAVRKSRKKLPKVLFPNVPVIGDGESRVWFRLGRATKLKKPITVYILTGRWTPEPAYFRLQKSLARRHK